MHGACLGLVGFAYLLIMVFGIQTLGSDVELCKVLQHSHYVVLESMAGQSVKTYNTVEVEVETMYQGNNDRARVEVFSDRNNVVASEDWEFVYEYYSNHETVPCKVVTFIWRSHIRSVDGIRTREFCWERVFGVICMVCASLLLVYAFFHLSGEMFDEEDNEKDISGRHMSFIKREFVDS